MSTSIHSRRQSPPQGFTLAEILISIAIFALLVSIVMGSFSGVFSPTEQLAVERNNNAMARSCLMRMATDLTNIYVEKKPFFTPPETAEVQSPYRFVATDPDPAGSTRILLQFTSHAHVDFSTDRRQGIAVIRYYLEPMEDGLNPTFRLRRGDLLSFPGELPEPANDPVVCENIRTLKIAYLDAEGESFEAWDSSSADYEFASPRAVRIRLELAAGEDVTIFQTVVTLPLWRPGSGKV